MKNEIVSEAPAKYGVKRPKAHDKRGLHRNAVLLHGVSWSTFEKLIEETGEDRKSKFAYDSGEFEIRTDWYTTAESRVVLHGVSWQTYETLLSELGESRGTRIAYDHGELEIMAPHAEHEGSNCSLYSLVDVLTREYKMRFKPLGALTCRRSDIDGGIEPDNCFYIQNAHRIKGAVDLDIDPPPDLMIEIDISRRSLNKLPICSALGVPEHWRFNGDVLEIRVLSKGKYVSVCESAIFPGLPLCDALPRFIKIGMDEDVHTMVDKFRPWVLQQLKKNQAPRRTGKPRS